MCSDGGSVVDLVVGRHGSLPAAPRRRVVRHRPPLDATASRDLDDVIAEQTFDQPRAPRYSPLSSTDSAWRQLYTVSQN